MMRASAQMSTQSASCPVDGGASAPRNTRRPAPAGAANPATLGKGPIGRFRLAGPAVSAAVVLLCLGALTTVGACSDGGCTPGEAIACDCPSQAVSVVCGDDGQQPPCLCVGGGKTSGPNGHLDWSKDVAVVLDTLTGLTWQRIASSAKFTWQDAKAHCAALVLAGYDDWQLPHKDELLTLVKTTTTKPAIDTAAFPDTATAPFWTRTLYGPLPDTHAWGIDFEDGGDGYAPFTEPHFARCVRVP